MKEDRRNDKHKEKRKHPRKTYVSKARYKVIVSNEVAMASRDKALTQNISERGVCLMLKRELSPGAILKLKLDFSGKEAKPLETLVKVVWQKKTKRGFLTGLKFGT